MGRKGEVTHISHSCGHAARNTGTNIKLSQRSHGTAASRIMPATGTSDLISSSSLIVSRRNTAGAGAGAGDAAAALEDAESTRDVWCCTLDWVDGGAREDSEV